MKGLDRKRILVVLVIAATILQAGAAGVCRLLRSEAEARRFEAHERRERAAIALELAEAASPSGADEGGARWRLAVESDVSRTMQFVQAAGDNAGVSLTVLEADPTDERGKRVVRVAGTGAPEQVCALLAAIEAREELLIVASGRVRPGTTTEIAFELDLASHHVEGEGGR